jgi:hypothetical protein
MYLFVLEDRATGAPIGTSLIIAKHGTLASPHFFMEIRTDDRSSKIPPRAFHHRVLRLGYSTDGPTEVGGLVLHPDHRRLAEAFGKQLSFVRFNFMARHPERFPDLSIHRLLSPRTGLDTLVVTKQFEESTRTFRWVQTREFSRTFEFSTPHADSTTEGSVIVPAHTYSGFHAVFVRARDDDAEYSDAARLAYSAMTIVPSSEIEHPIVSADVLTTGTTIRIRWNGTDPDGANVKHKPIGFIYRMLDLDSLDPSPSLLHVQPSVLLAQAERESPWMYMDADTAQVTFQLNNRGRYVFGVRAVDEAGAVEPFLDLGRNAFRFQALSSAGFPKLHVQEATAGAFDFRGTTGALAAEAPAGAPLRFTWTLPGLTASSWFSCGLISWTWSGRGRVQAGADGEASPASIPPSCFASRESTRCT